MAASHCLGLIADHFVHITPDDLRTALAVPYSATRNDEHHQKDPTLLSFDTFQVSTVLEKGTHLGSSEGGEYDVVMSTNSAEELKRQRENLKKRLGFTGAAEQFLSTAEIFKDEDLIVRAPNVQETTKEKVEEDSTGLSIRQQMIAARKRKIAPSTDLDPKRAKSGTSTNSSINTDSNQQTDDGVDDEAHWQAILSGQWPFQNICDSLCIDLLHPNWCVRHGAALGLREILRSQAPAAAVIAPLAASPHGWTCANGEGKLKLGEVGKDHVAFAVLSNFSWLEDCSLRLISTLALDRFGDYMGDQVTAPVRETAAQALGIVSRALPVLTVDTHLFGALHTLVDSTAWEARHGGLQGLKYVLASRLAPDLPLDEVLTSIMLGLGDDDDDVKAVAAEALLPIADKLLINGPNPKVQRTIGMVWDVLLSDQELSPAVKGATAVLAAVYGGVNSELLSINDDNLMIGDGLQFWRLIPRLWLHLRHSLVSIRRSVVTCMTALVTSRQSRGAGDDNEEARIQIEETLRDTARLIFQNIVLESDGEVLNESLQAWSVLVQHLGSTGTEDISPHSIFPSSSLNAMFALASTPFDSTCYYQQPSSRKAQNTAEPGASGYDARLFVHAVRSSDIQQNQSIVTVPGINKRQQQNFTALPINDSGWITRMRCTATRALGLLASCPDLVPPLHQYVLSALASPRAAAKLVGALLAEKLVSTSTREALVQALTKALENDSTVDYEDLKRQTVYVATQARTFQQRWCPHLNIIGLPISSQTSQTQVIEAAKSLLNQISGLGIDVSESNVSAALQGIQDSLASLTAVHSMLHTTVTGSMAGSVVRLLLDAAPTLPLPPKLNSIIQPLMAAVRREPEAMLRDRAAKALALLALGCTSRQPSPTGKIIKNVCSFACVPLPGQLEENRKASRQNWDAVALTHTTDPKVQPTMGDEESEADPALKAALITKAGGEAALEELARTSGQGMLTDLSQSLWHPMIESPLQSYKGEDPTAVTNALEVLRIIAPALHPAVQLRTLSLLPCIAACLSRDNGPVQEVGARTVAALAASNPVGMMPGILSTLSTLMSNSASVPSRYGAVLTMQSIIDKLGLKMVPYVKLAVVPLLARMSDSDPLVRGIASKCFASVVNLIPLAYDAKPPPGISDEQKEMLEKEGRFLQQLLDNETVDDVVLPFTLKTGTLRPYQQEGINWLAFLRKFGLHGVLADDMGLGKTLQATTIIAMSVVEARAKYSKTQDPSHAPRPSLIVCPASLVAHWPYEMNKFVDEDILRVLQYQPKNLTNKSELVGSNYDVVVISYESLRAGIDWVSSIKWSYCVLDEGHAIRNPSSKLALAVKRVDAQHRLILSGTPIQNSVHELWALFDFLMPGFLGSHRAFTSRFGSAGWSKQKKAATGPSKNEAGLLALDALHRQVMPFILRRTKDQVLDDLPPKTIQDVFCDLGRLQQLLYEDFTTSQAMSTITDSMISSQGDGGTPTHIFQALHYLRRLCSHPLLVLDPGIPSHERALAKVLGPARAKDWHSARSTVASHLEHAPKLVALKELLLDCGIGMEVVGDNDDGNGNRSGNGDKATGKGKAKSKGAVKSEDELRELDTAGHRILIFAQNRALLDIVETSVLKQLGVESLRIDGGVDATERFRRVQRFNADPTIEVMLLTTAVGGLGLNLTAADTVIFLEHDWNPQKDLQAMDRAHRLGQRRAVNVYRLLMRGTLEEHVMSLQKFKLDMAAAVVNAENVSMSAMDTENLLDLFTYEPEGGKEKQRDREKEHKEKPGRGGGLTSLLAELPDAEATEAQYGEEFDLEAFRRKLVSKDGGT